MACIVMTGSAGGAAMAAGQRFQAKVTAWWAARILLETPIGEPFALPFSAVAEAVAPETGDDIDDVRVRLGTPAGTALVFGQCKRSLHLGQSLDGEWAKTLRQFSRQHVNDDAVDAVDCGIASPERRYVLFYEEHNRNLRRLKTVLDRYRTLSLGSAFDKAALNKSEQIVAEDLITLLDALALKDSTNARATSLLSGRETLLRRTCIRQLCLAAGDADALSVQESLQYGALSDPRDVNRCLDSLRVLADDLMADRHSGDRTSLRRRLSGCGVKLKDSPTFVTDFRRLSAFADDELAAHEAQGRRRVRIHGHAVVIERPKLWHYIERSDANSVLVTGGAGAGKTGALMDAARRLREQGTLVWYWAADSLPETSLSAIQTHLQLEHPWPALFGEARAAGSLVLVIDGLDGLREAASQQAYQNLIGIAQTAGVRVVASIRSFDLQFADRIQKLFPADPDEKSASVPSGSAYGRTVNAVDIGELDDTELGLVETSLPQVRQALEKAPALRDLVRNLFNLDLLCQLLETGADALALSGISTQGELFDRYWQRRILDQTNRQALLAALNATVNLMVDERRLQVSPVEEHAVALDELRSVGMLRTPAALPGRAALERCVEFSHHVMFDYAAERLFVRTRQSVLGTDLTPENPWPLMLRPSLVLFFRHLWATARLDFWDTLTAIEIANATALHRFSAYTVIAEEATSRGDFDRMFDGSLGSDSWTWTRILRGVIVVAPFTALPRLFAIGEGEWWLVLANDLVTSGDNALAYLGRRLLFAGADHLATLTGDAKRVFNHAAISLVRWQQANEPPSLSLRPAIEWVCQTIGANPGPAAALIRELLTPEQIAESGFIVLGALAGQVDELAVRDAALAREIYRSAFSYNEKSREATPMGGVILSMRSNRQQDYEMALHQLGEVYPSVFRASPVEGTRTAIDIMRHIATRGGEINLDKLPLDQLFIDGTLRSFRDDRTHRWHAPIWRQESAKQILNHWEGGVQELGRAALIANAVAVDAPSPFDDLWQTMCLENEFAGLWGRLLVAGALVPEFYAPRLWRLLLEPPVLVCTNTIEAAGQALAAFSAVLAPADVAAIETAILALSPSSEDYDRGRADVVRARLFLLERIPVHLRSSRAAEMVADGEGDHPAPTDEPRIYVGSREVTTKTLLDDAGVDTAHPVHAALLAEIEALESLTGDRAPIPDPDVVMDVIHRIESTVEASKVDLHLHVMHIALAGVIRAASALALSPAALDQAAVRELALRFEKLLAESGQVPDEESGRRFDDMAMWGSDDIRTNAARGVIGLALRPNEFALQAAYLRRIAADVEPQVRLQLATHLWRFFKDEPQFVWDVLEQWVKVLAQPGSAGVMKFALPSAWFWWLRERDEDRADRLLGALLVEANANGSRELRELASRYVSVLCYTHDPGWAKAHIKTMFHNPSIWCHELQGVLREATTRALPREGFVPDDGRPDATPRARQLAIDVLDAVAVRLRELDSEQRALAPALRPKEHPPWVITLAGLSHIVAAEFRIAAIACVRAVATPVALATVAELDDGGPALDEDVNSDIAEVKSTQHTDADLDLWLATSLPLLEVTIAFPQAATAYDIVQGCEALSLVLPIRTLLLLRRVTELSVETGLTTDRMAADRTIDILARILSSDDGTLASDEKARTDFVQTLGAYLDVGWPKAIELALRIETIFRSR